MGWDLPGIPFSIVCHLVAQTVCADVWQHWPLPPHRATKKALRMTTISAKPGKQKSRFFFPSGVVDEDNNFTKTRATTTTTKTTTTTTTTTTRNVWANVLDEALYFFHLHCSSSPHLPSNTWIANCSQPLVYLFSVSATAAALRQENKNEK